MEKLIEIFIYFWILLNSKFTLFKTYQKNFRMKSGLWRRCQKNVAKNCGINAKLMAAELAQLGLTGDKMSIRSKKKVEFL